MPNPTHDPMGNPYEVQRENVLKAQAIRTQRAHERAERAKAKAEHHKWEPEFDGVTAPMFLVDMQFMRTGDIIIKMRVPFRWRHLVLPLSEGYNQPLEATITKWSRADAERQRIRQQYRTRQVGTTGSERESD